MKHDNEVILRPSLNYYITTNKLEGRKLFIAKHHVWNDLTALHK